MGQHIRRTGPNCTNWVGNQSVAVNGLVAQLVRDVFVAATTVHKKAMSKFEGMTQNMEGMRGNGVDDGDDPDPQHTEGSMELRSNVEKEF